MIRDVVDPSSSKYSRNQYAARQYFGHRVSKRIKTIRCQNSLFSHSQIDSLGPYYSIIASCQAHIAQQLPHVRPTKRAPLIITCLKLLRSHGAPLIDLTIAVDSLHRYRLYGIPWRNSLNIELEFQRLRLESVREPSTNHIAPFHQNPLRWNIDSNITIDHQDNHDHYLPIHPPISFKSGSLCLLHLQLATRLMRESIQSLLLLLPPLETNIILKVLNTKSSSFL